MDVGERNNARDMMKEEGEAFFALSSLNLEVIPMPILGTLGAFDLCPYIQLYRFLA